MGSARRVYRGMVDRFTSATSSKMHKRLTFLWIALAIPSLTVWKDSLLWVIVMSLWANVAGHWSAYQGAKAEEAQQS